MVAESVQWAAVTIGVEHPTSTIWLGTPAYVGEKVELGVEVKEPDVAVRV
jgi:hypothetical protein